MNQSRRIGVLFYLLSVTALLYFAFRNHAYDDPFITYRYAENIAVGRGFVYNPGERVLSTTTPLFTMILAVLVRIPMAMPRMAVLLGAAGTALGGILLWDIARSMKTPWAGWAGLFLYPSSSLMLSTLGSEMPLYVALCLASLAAYARRRYGPAALCAALAVLARPDGMLAAAVLALHYAGTRARNREPGTPFWRPVVSPLLAFLGILMLWGLFAWNYFGSPLPVTLAAKLRQGDMAISRPFAAGFMDLVRDQTAWNDRLGAGLAILGLVFLLWRARGWSPLVGWTILYFVVYYLSGVSEYFWYYAPLVPAFAALVGLGMEALARMARADGRLRKWMAAAVAMGLVSLTAAQAVRSWSISRIPDPRCRIYRAAGEWLASHVPARASVGMLEIGMIGYYARRPVVDFAGLIQPELNRRIQSRSTYQDIALWAVDHHPIDFLILHRGLFPALEQGFVAAHCRLLKSFRGEDYGYTRDLDVYACHR